MSEDKLGKRGNFITDYFFTKKQRDFFSTSNHLYDHLRHELGVDTEYIYKEVLKVVVKSLIAVEPSMRHQEQDRFSHQQSVYEVVGYDIVIDKNLKPFVCEVNTTPNMGLEINRGNDAVVHEEDFELKTRIMRSTLELTGELPVQEDHPNAKLASYVC